MERLDPGFQKRLKELVGENVSDFARKIGIPQPSLHGYLTGKYAPGFEFFSALAKRGVDVNWLLTGEERKAKHPLARAANSQKIVILLSKLNKQQEEVVIKTMETLVKGLSRRSK